MGTAETNPDEYRAVTGALLNAASPSRDEANVCSYVTLDFDAADDGFFRLRLMCRRALWTTSGIWFVLRDRIEINNKLRAE